MPVYDQDGKPLPLQPGDILFYNTEKRWPGGFGPNAANRSRAFDNWLIRFLQRSPNTHTAIVVEVNPMPDDEHGEPQLPEVKIIDIVADRVVNIHEIREGDYRLEGTVFRPSGTHAREISSTIAKIAKSHVGEDNIGFSFSRAKTWSTISWITCCMPFFQRPYEDKKQSYADFVLNDLYAQREQPRFGQSKDDFPTYCSEFSGILLLLSIKEVLERKHLIHRYDAWMHEFAACLELTTTANLHHRLASVNHEAPLELETFRWQNEHVVKQELKPDEHTRLVNS